MHPLTYDPNSPQEKPVSLPSAPLVSISSDIVLQPPLSRRGTGPGLIVFLPASSQLASSTKPRSLDPEPIQKWAEEGFSVVGITGVSSSSSKPINEYINIALDGLLALKQLDINNKFGIISYDPELIALLATVVETDYRIVSLILYASSSSLPLSVSFRVPTTIHLASSPNKPQLSANTTIYIYSAISPNFVLPQSAAYDPGSAAIAHSRNLVFLRKNIGGPFFDLEAIWEEHTYFEFEVRSVAQTMGTMVAEPYVNHVPTMTGGVGRANLIAFYRDHFIFSNPPDAMIQTITRTVGPDRVVDEFLFIFTHDRIVDWLLPGIPPTGKKFIIPMIAVVNIRGDRLYNEHIWWDQGTALRQAAVLPEYLPYPTPAGNRMLRLPVAGVESAQKLVDEASGTSNEMFNENWGIQDTPAP